MNPIVEKLGRLRDRARRGIAAVEFALSMPIWITLLLGMGDGTYYLLVNEKVDRIAYTVADIVTQYQLLTLLNLKDITAAAAQLMNPYTFGNNGIVIVSSVYQPPTVLGVTPPPVVLWQYAGGGTAPAASHVGIMGSKAALPNGLVLNGNDNVIIAEAFYNFQPLFVSSHLFGASTVYRVASYKPRLSQLTIPPT